jgi:hypothetical protein
MITTDQTLRCAVCQAPMALSEAAPVPEGPPITLRYHARLDDCVRGMLARWAIDRSQARADLHAAGWRAGETR